MKYENEFVVGHLLPAIRSTIASELAGSYGLTQEEIAKNMDLTQPAVSQYINEKRSSKKIKDKLNSDPQVALLLDEAVSKAAKGKDYSEQIKDVLRTVRDKGIFSSKFSELDKLDY